MPNLSPSMVREKYLLYNDKSCTGDEAAEHIEHLKMRMKEIGYDCGGCRLPLCDITPENLAKLKKCL